MSEELKQAISALQCAKRGHCDHAMADEAIAALEALTQRPAAQTEREAPYGYCPECGAPGVTRERRPDGDDKCSNGHRYPSRSASLPTQPAAQDEREADEVFLPRRLAATQKLTQLGYRYDSAHGKWLPAPQQATPEPVGEPFGYFRALPFGWEQCGEHDDGAVALYDRPAPGVPEGWRIFRTHDGLDVHTPDGDACYVESKATGDRRIPEEVLHALCCDLLAAAQAKGWQ